MKKVELELVNHPLEEVRAFVARNPFSTPEMLQRLAQDTSHLVRAGVAENPAIGPDLLRELARDPHPTVRRAVALHPQTPPELLEELAHDTAPGSLLVQEAVARNPKTPASVLLALLQGQAARGWMGWVLATQVMANPNTPREALAGLEAEQSPWVRRGLQRLARLAPATK